MATTTETCPVCGVGTVTVEAEVVAVEGAGEQLPRVIDMICSRDCDPELIKEALKARGVNMAF